MESKWYQYWLDHKLFSSRPDGREPYTVVIPPPNVTGVLHMGHMLNNTIQDILVRRARMEGKNACWVPGTDHASIATEAKVVARLAEEGIKKSDLTREEFLPPCLGLDPRARWHHPQAAAPSRRLLRLGPHSVHDGRGAVEERASMSLSTSTRRDSSTAVVRMVNWDPKAQTVLSDRGGYLPATRRVNLFNLRYYVADADVNPVVRDRLTRPRCMHQRRPTDATTLL